MIEVINRELLIPREEYNIGTNYDNDSDIRQFHLKRITSGGVDLANLTFQLDIKYANGNTDTAMLEKEVTEKDIVLTLEILNSMLQVLGSVLIQIRALSGDGTVKWTSYQGTFFVEDVINTPPHYEGQLTELEQFETLMAAQRTAEAARVVAENQRVQDSAERIEAMDDIIAEWDERKDDFEAFATKSESYAVGGTGSRDDEDMDNAKYYSEVAANYAGIKVPRFIYDPETGGLYSTAASGLVFMVEDGNLYWSRVTE